MSVLHPSRTTRRLLKIASLGLAGLLAGLLAGCSANPGGLVLSGHEDTDWYTIPNYASATAEMAPGSISRSARMHAPLAAGFRPEVAPAHLHPAQPRN